MAIRKTGIIDHSLQSFSAKNFFASPPKIASNKNNTQKEIKFSPSILVEHDKNSSVSKRRKMPSLQLDLIKKTSEIFNKPTFLIPRSQAEMAAEGLVQSSQSKNSIRDTNSEEMFQHRLSMDPAFIGEEKGLIFKNNELVQYLTPQQRDELKVGFKDGKIIDKNGKVLDTQSIVSEFPPDNRRAIFVMDLSGNIYISTFKAKGFFQHSSFMAGEPVACAGYIEIENGIVNTISRKSGHYKSGLENLDQLMARLNHFNVQVHKEFHVDISI